MTSPDGIAKDALDSNAQCSYWIGVRDHRVWGWALLVRNLHNLVITVARFGTVGLRRHA